MKDNGKITILLAYPHNPGTTGWYLERALKKLCNVLTYDLNQTPLWKSKYSFGFPTGIPKSIQQVIRFTGTVPDAVLEVDGDGKYHLTGYRRLKIPAFYWAIDSHSEYKRSFQRLIAKDFEHIFVAQKEYLSMFAKMGKSVSWLPLACDPEIHHPYPQEQKKYDVVFVGNLNSPRRRELLNKLSSKFKVAILTGLKPAEMARAYSMAPLAFNCSVNNDINMRIFETLACRRLLLTDQIRNNGFDELFTDREHLVIYDDSTLEPYVKHYLDNPSEIERISKNGFDLVTSRHTYLDRAKKMLSLIC